MTAKWELNIRDHFINEVDATIMHMYKQCMSPETSEIQGLAYIYQMNINNKVKFKLRKNILSKQKNWGTNQCKLGMQIATICVHDRAVFGIICKNCKHLNKQYYKKIDQKLCRDFWIFLMFQLI